MPTYRNELAEIITRTQQAQAERNGGHAFRVAMAIKLAFVLMLFFLVLFVGLVVKFGDKEGPKAPAEAIKDFSTPR